MIDNLPKIDTASFSWIVVIPRDLRLLRLHICHINFGSLLRLEQNKQKTGVRLTYGLAMGRREF